MNGWTGPGKCKGCGARVWFNPRLGWWCERPAQLPLVRHVCPEVAK